MDPKVHSRCEWKNHLSPATLMMGLAINFTCIERQTMTDSRQILLYNRKVINKNIRMCMCYSSLFGWYYWNQMCMIWPKHLLILCLTYMYVILRYKSFIHSKTDSILLITWHTLTSINFSAKVFNLKTHPQIYSQTNVFYEKKTLGKTNELIQNEIVYH